MKRVGLLGGSFNPAHAGHIHLSLTAIRKLKLDEVWWLVSPQNPLKSKKDLAPYPARLAQAHELTKNYSRIRVTNIEQRQHLRFTYATLRYLCTRFPRTRFVWLMGADNLGNFHRWRRWQEIAARMAFAVFDRAPVTHPALRSLAASALKPWRLAGRSASQLLTRQPPVWTYIFMQRHAASSTALRKRLGKSAFLAHNKDG